jgi:hypothetical protein
MEQSYVGQVRGGMVVFDDSPVPLPEGTKVRIMPIEPRKPSTSTLAERYADFIGIIKGLPADLAVEHDHYIHGTPRKGDA